MSHPKTPHGKLLSRIESWADVFHGAFIISGLIAVFSLACGLLTKNFEICIESAPAVFVSLFFFVLNKDFRKILSDYYTETRTESIEHLSDPTNIMISDLLKDISRGNITPEETCKRIMSIWSEDRRHTEGGVT